MRLFYRWLFHMRLSYRRLRNEHCPGVHNYLGTCCDGIQEVRAKRVTPCLILNALPVLFSYCILITSLTVTLSLSLSNEFIWHQIAVSGHHARHLAAAAASLPRSGPQGRHVGPLTNGTLGCWWGQPDPSSCCACVLASSAGHV